ncbi:sialate O-acetylesterase [Membranicola marinus]|uniref:Sialate O-acetylesterase n=1 Tax=Membranihabitans marinus TaxID=1227546 RepID=A0A953HW65_9BACT|nr:sialate O-acetylesterase [Membranihabitans marinus]MBY5959286.1 sialate O-acetylesterase [Membranihabitans marinus]
MKKTHPIIGFVLILILPLALHSQTKLPTFFSDHMVLQQNEEVAIWGWDDAGKKINIEGSWGQKATTKTDGSGKWETRLQTPSAGGPYTLTISGNDEIQLQDVMIGEVWICSGQSNMQMTLNGYGNQPIFDAGDAILYANQSGIRMYTGARKASVEAMTDMEGTWQVSSTKNAPGFSAAAYFFGRVLEDVLEVPVGLIITSWGGSKVEAWMDKKSLRKSNVNEFPNEVPEKAPNHAPTLLYNGMIKPLVPFTAKGFLWYQGESNVSNADEYTQLFSDMITLWRSDFQNPDMPFYFVEIAPYNYGGRNSSFLREAQLQTMLQLPNTGMAGTMDLGNCTNIHPGNKKDVGRRLALWALSQTYGLEGFQYSGPVYHSMKKTDDHKIILSFDHAGNGLSTFGQPLKGFEIAGKDGNFVPAEATIGRNAQVTVWSSQVSNPQVVRYGFSNCPEATLYNMEKLPAPSFRTDFK